MVGSEARTDENESDDDAAWPECVWGVPDGALMPLGSADSPSVVELNAESALTKFCVLPSRIQGRRW